MALRSSAPLVPLVSLLLFAPLACGGLIEIPAPPAVATSPDGRATVHVDFAAPIAVGHRLTVRWYRAADGETRPYEPVVEDVDTGVVYATESWFDTPGIRRRGTPTPVGGLRAGVIEERVLRGKVESCRVISMEWGGYSVQTTIVLAQGEERAGP